MIWVVRIQLRAICYQTKRLQKHQLGGPGDVWRMHHDQALSRKAGGLTLAGGFAIEAGRCHMNRRIVHYFQGIVYSHQTIGYARFTA